MSNAMNTSLFTADRGTHLKIVMVALIAATVIATVAFNARIVDPPTLTAHDRGQGLVVKAGEPARYSVRDAGGVR